MRKYDTIKMINPHFTIKFKSRRPCFRLLPFIFFKIYIKKETVYPYNLRKKENKKVKRCFKESFNLLYEIFYVEVSLS